MKTSQCSYYKLPTKLLSVILSFMMVFSTGIISCYAEGLGIFDSIETHSIISDSIEEMIDLNGVKSVDKDNTQGNELYLNMKDGSTTVYTFSEPVTYIDENGNLKCKSTSISEINEKDKNALGYDYGNEQNDYKIYFSSDSSKGVLVEYKDFSFSMAPISESSSPGYISTGEICNQKFEDFEYADLYGYGTYLKYFPQFNGIKEEIILDEKINSNTFSFTFTTKNCYPILNNDGSISLLNSEKEEVQKFAAPFAYDSAYIQGMEDEHYTDECDYSLTETEDNCYILTITVSNEWLNSGSTVYPVIIDPTTENLQSGMDLPIHSTRSTSGTSGDNNAVGKSSQYGTSRSLVYMGWPGEIKSHAKVNSAYYYARELTGRTSNMNIDIHKVTSHWNNSYTWDNQPSYDSKVLDTVNINGNFNGGSTYWYKFNITSIVQDHINGADNQGFLMKYSDESGTNNLRTFAQLEYSTSSMRPYIVINYSNDTIAPTVESVTKSPSSTWSADDVTITVNGAQDNESGLADKAYSFSTDPYKTNWQDSNKFTVTNSCHVWIHVRDNAGNSNYCACIRVDIDREAPVISSITSTENNDDSIVLQVNATDSGSGISKYSLSSEPNEYNWSDNPSREFTQNGTVYGYVKDKAGNVSNVCTYEISAFDTTAPSTPTITGAPDGWSTGDVTITALSTDDQSGVAAYSFSTKLGEYEWQKENIKTFTESTTVYVYAKDNKGNISEPNTIQIKIDKTAPSGATVSGNASNWTKDDIVLTVNNASDNISGLNAAAYSFSATENEYEWQEENSKAFSSNCTVYISIRDVAGNITHVDKILINKIDKSAPRVSVNKTDKDGKTTITVDGTDSGSGVALYSFDGGQTWQEANSYTFTQNSYNFLTIWVKDNVGNIGKKYYEINSPKLYEEDGLIGFYNPNPAVSSTIYYSANTNIFFRDWKNYTTPLVYNGNGRKIYVSYSESTTFEDSTAIDIPASDYIGTYSESNTDATFTYRNVNFDFTRYYNSDSGWFYSYNSKLTFVDKGLIYGDMPDNSRRAFLYKNESEYYNESTDAELKFIYNENGTLFGYEVTYNNTVYGYDTDGMLSYIADRFGNKISISRSENSIVFVDDANRSYTVSLDNSGNIISLTDAAGGIITYSRDNDSRLIKVTDQSGVILSEYEYNSDNLIKKSLDKEIVYDDDNRVLKYIYDNGAYTNYEYSTSDNTAQYGSNGLIVDTGSYHTDTITVKMSSGEAYKTEFETRFHNVNVNGSTEYNLCKGVYFYENEEKESEYHLITDLYGNIIEKYTKDSDSAITITNEFDEYGNIIKSDDTQYSYDSLGRCTREQSYSNQKYITIYYIYDSSDNVVKVATLESDQDELDSIPQEYDDSLTYDELTEYTYSSGLLTKSVDVINDIITTYDYDAYGNVVKVASTSQTDQGTAISVTNYTYDIMGNILTVQNDSSSSSFVYDSAGRQLRSNTDGEVSRTLYDEYGRVIQQIDSDVYDESKDGLPDENTYSDSSAGHRYIYAENGNLVSEFTKYGLETVYTYSDIGNLLKKHFDIYDYCYLENGNIDKILVDGETVVDYSYNVSGSVFTIQKGEYVNQVSYANGDVESYKYNENGVLTAMYKNDEEQTKAYWSKSVNIYNNLLETWNYETDLRYNYDEENNSVFVYDGLSNYFGPTLLSSYETSQTNSDDATGTPATSTFNATNFNTNFSIFTDGSKIVNTVGELSNTYTYEIDEDGYIISDYIISEDNTVLPTEYDYDSSNRNIKKSILMSNEGELSLDMQYDNNGMIIGNGINGITSQYYYDSYNQLIRTNDNCSGYTSAYEYDSRGNMLSKKVFNLTTEDLSNLTPSDTTVFTYSNSGWKDQLTSVNGTSLTYDENGNLLTYGDKSYSWVHGTRLESIADGENTYNYLYDENGVRVSKTVNGETTQFNYVGGLLLSQKSSDDVIFFQYGTGNTPLGFVYNGTQYFYITNQLGDVLGITDSTGNLIASYQYDEWGKVLKITTADENSEEQRKIADINPLRYRGYYYDCETGYYYLQSRYYNPEWGRFLSADSFSYIDNSTRMGFNAYVYCMNNPIMFVDPSGHKTNDVGLAILKTLCVCIEIDAITDFFEDLMQSIDIDFNFNDWYDDLPKPDRDILGEISLYFATMFNDLSNSLLNDIMSFSLSEIVEKLIDEKANAGGSLIDVLTGSRELKLFPIVDSIISLVSNFRDWENGVFNSEQTLILNLSEVILSIVDIFTEVNPIIDKVADVIIYLTEIFFKYTNGEYI